MCVISLDHAAVAVGRPWTGPLPCLGLAWPGLQVHDIEELKKVCGESRNSLCPYYASRELAAGAELVFCPYR